MTQPLILNLDVDTAQAINSINAFFDVYEKGVDGMAQSLGQALGKPVEVAVQLKMEGDKIISEGVEKLDKSVQQVEAAAKLMNNEFGKTPNSLKIQLKLLKDLQGNTRKFADDGKTVTKSWEKVQALIDEVNRLLKEMSNIGDKGGGGRLADTLLNSQLAADGLMGTFHALTGAVSNFISTGMEMEVLFIQLQGFTGGVQQAADAYKRFVEIGAATPFTAKEVATAARTMMGFGIETDKAIDQVDRLAIVAAATGGELTHMARNLGQIQANQKAYTRDLMQFANQGIPIYQKIADILDVTTEEVREMAEEGQIGFTEVSAALRDMTKEGTAFALIADKMDRTFSAKMEAMRSAVESFAGNFLASISEFDNAIGGPLAAVLQGAIDLIMGVSDAIGHMSANMQAFAPLIAGVTTAFGFMFLAAAVENFTAVASAIKTVLTVTKLWTVAQWALNAAKAVGQALLGNFATIAIAAAAAAAIAAIEVQHNADALEAENTALEESRGAREASIDSREKEAFATDNLTMATKRHIEALKEEYDALKQDQDLAKKRAQSAVQWAEAELKAFKESQKERRAELKETAKLEKDLHKQNTAQIKKDYKDRIKLIDQELNKKLEVIDAELDRLDEKSEAEKEIERRERKALELKLRRLKVGSDEWLQTKVQLEQMDKQIQREELLKQREEERARAADKKTEAEGNRDKAIKAEDARHENEMKNINDEVETLDKAFEAEKAKVDEMKGVYDDFFNNLGQQRFDDHQAAMTYLNDEILEWQRLGREAEKAIAKADAAKKKGQKVDPNEQGILINENGLLNGLLASGGPAKAGGRYVVNELGKEAFLSASGRLSMINAPSWGVWKAPSDGTVIPAHLTKQLDIPAGGININNTPSMRGGAYGSTVSTTLASGDSIMNNVTVQAINPSKTASDMLVSLTKVRRRRYR